MRRLRPLASFPLSVYRLYRGSVVLRCGEDAGKYGVQWVLVNCTKHAGDTHPFRACLLSHPNRRRRQSFDHTCKMPGWTDLFHQQITGVLLLLRWLQLRSRSSSAASPAQYPWPQRLVPCLTTVMRWLFWST